MKEYQLYLIGSFLALLSYCNSNNKKNNSTNMENTSLYKGAFGTCCKDLKEALDSTLIPNSFFRVEKHNILFLTVGYVLTDSGAGYFDQAVIYCPFCGQKIQDKNEIKTKTTQ